MTRTDGMPIKYHKQEDGSFRSVVDEKSGKSRAWNIEKLSSNENPLVIFTLTTQASMGAFLAIFLGPLLGFKGMESIASSTALFPVLFCLIALQCFGLFLSTTHLGKPMRFYRGFNNLAQSPVAREAFGIALYCGFLTVYTGLKLLNLWLDSWLISLLAGISGLLAVLAIAGGMFYMYKSYQIKARPFWNHPQVATSFVGSMFSLGAIVVAAVSIPALALASLDWQPVLSICACALSFGLIMEGLGLIAHAHYLNTEQGEGAAAHYIQCTTFGNSYYARNAGIAAAVLLSALSIWSCADSQLIATLLFILAIPLVLTCSIVSRALFYVLVIPTTMPGAFFWKNKSFEEHARDIGLADMPQVGVVPDLH